MLQVGIDTGQNVPFRGAETINHSRSQARVLHPAEEPYPGMGQGNVLCDRPGTIGRVVVHDENLIVDIA